jgi:hypothetical protein
MKLYRAVSHTELQDIRTSGIFRDSRKPSGKGFFFERVAAEDFAKWAAMDDGEEYFIVETDAADALVELGTQHIAVQEGPGVDLRTEDLAQLIPKY